MSLTDIAGLERLINLPYRPSAVRWETSTRPGGNDWSLTALLTFQPREAQALLAAPSGDAGTLRVAPEHLAWFPVAVRERHPAPADGGAVAMPEARSLGPLPFAAARKSPLLNGAALVFPADGLVYLVLYTM